RDALVRAPGADVDVGHARLLDPERPAAFPLGFFPQAERLPSSHLPRHDVPSAALVRLPSKYRMRRSWSSAGPRSSRNAAAKTSLGMPVPRSSAVNVASGFRV